jgi:predicted AAA+ superfamily ATPase
MGFRPFADALMTAHGGRTPQVPLLDPSDLRTPEAHDALDDLVPWVGDLATWWEIYLQVGGFPQAVAAQISGEDLAPVVRALLDVVQRDALADTSLSATQVLALLDRLVRGLCSPVNVTNLASEVGISHDTARRRLDDLARAFILWPCHQSQDLLPKLRAQSKWYFVDPLLSRLAHLTTPGRGEPDATQLTEQQLGVALLRSGERRSPGSYVDFDRVLYARTPTRKEIDFVGPELDPVAIEAKYADGDRWRGAASTINASTFAGVLGTRTVLDTSAAGPEQSWAVPAALLAYVIDG